MIERYNEAYEHFSAGLKYAGLSVDDRERAAMLMGLGFVCRERGNLNMALGLSAEALRVFEETQQADVVADLHNNIGLIHSLRGDRVAARASYERALAILGVESFLPAAEAHRELARLDMEEGRLDRAVDRARSALAIAMKLDHDPEIARCSLVLAQALMGQGLFEAARGYLPRALDTFTQLGLRQPAIIAAQLLRDAQAP